MKNYKNYYCCIKNNIFELGTIAETKEYSKERLIKQFVKKPTWLQLKKKGYQCVLIDITLTLKP